MQAVDVQWLSIIPPVVAIVLALITKEVFSSLLAGIFTGTFIYAWNNAGMSVPIGTVETAFKLMAQKLDFGILVFCSLLGAIVYVIALAGGAKAYGKAAMKVIRGRRSALAATAGLGMVIFIDDYFNCLTVGTVMRPLTDAYRISRAKLAYIIDSTAAPICIIAPVSSWAVAVGSSLASTGAFDSQMDAFISTVPWNFYALLSIGLMLFLVFFREDFGPMYSAERKALAGDMGKVEESLGQKPLTPANPRGTLWDMVLPLASLIVLSVLSLLWSGGYWGSDPQFHAFGAAMGNSSATISLEIASFASLLICFFLYIPRGLMTFKQFMEGCVEGMKTMLPANIILVLAWTLSGVCRDLLNTPHFMENMVTASGMGAAFLPFGVFILAAFLSFSIGTAWGTFGIFIPIVVPVVQALDPALTIVVLSATLAGSVFGDHCSPISDTTVLSSAGAGCHHMKHVETQIPYAVLVAVCSSAGYLVAGFTRGDFWLSLSASVVSLLAATLVLHALAERRLKALG